MSSGLVQTPPTKAHEDGPMSVKDSNTFVAKYIPDFGYRVKDFTSFCWPVNSWGKLQRRLISPEFECGGHKWHILLFPFGNSNTPPHDTVSLYLVRADNQKSPKDWHACAQFAIAISNPHDPTLFTVSHAYHRFNAGAPDWGFTKFGELPKLFTVQEGQTRPTVENESAEITVFVRVLDDPTGVLWHNFVGYDSKKETGYVGLTNKGAVKSFLNYVLQSLYCTNYFRKAVYQIPKEGDNPSERLVLDLQHLFYNLQTSDRSVGTDQFIRSFGWTSADDLLQADPEEFQRVLFYKLEPKLEGPIKKMFVGKMKSYIRCIDVNFESSRVEEFDSLQLRVKGMKNLYESFKDYVAVDILDGENKYPVQGHGLQDAKKGITFQSFPSVLNIQLRRFEYDISCDAMVALNDRFELPSEIDMEEFLDEGADRSSPWVYKLHGVLARSSYRNGHYFAAFIKPGKDKKWLKFDDDHVTPVTDKEVLEDNFGGERYGEVLQGKQVSVIKKVVIAYLLVYIRESAMDEVFCPISEEDIPEHLNNRRDKTEMQAKAKRREVQDLGINPKSPEQELNVALLVQDMSLETQRSKDEAQKLEAANKTMPTPQDELQAENERLMRELKELKAELERERMGRVQS
ncbi:hypothetical protein DL96DRAFT_1664651 [Flagelloscypha sp. PMI_526]|nr:hypothetical protein DL96DRAFT_1664651 [Flagelloscypha sp. PMI_526]